MSTATAADSAPGPVRGVLPWLVAAALFMGNLDATVLNTAVPTMAADLGVPALSLNLSSNIMQSVGWE
jgi:hypothetical protein